MKYFRDISIGRKLTLDILAASIVPLVIAAALVFGYELASLRARAVRDLAARAELLAVSTRATLEFNDAERAVETLATLRARPEMFAAGLYTPDGRVFASYRRADAAAFAFPRLPAGDAGTARPIENHLELFHPIRSGRDTVGHVYLRSDLAMLYERLPEEGLIVLGVLAGLVVVAYWLSREFRRAISRPILALAGTAQAVRERKDYSMRARKHGQDEIGTLTDGFNQMLAGIQERDNALHTANEALRAENAEREQAEDALRESEERLNFALKKSRTGGWELDLVDHTAHRSLEHDRIFGYGSLLPQWTYEMFLEHVLPEDRVEVDRRFREATAAQTEWSFECRIRRADGEVRWIWATGEHQRDEAGQMRRMAGIVQDITERKRAEDALRASEERTRLIIETALDAVVTIDSTGVITGWSPQAETTFGWMSHQAIGCVLSETIIPDRHREAHRRGMHRYLATGEAVVLNKRIEITALHRDGREFPIELAITPIRIGETVVFSAFVRDITERKRAEEEIQRLNADLEKRVLERTAQLEAANKELEAFSYSVSHDLRAPLRAVDGFSRIVVEKYAGRLDDDGRRMLGVVRSETQRMGRLIDDLLAFSRLGRQKIEPAQIDMHAQAQAVFDELAALEPGRKLRLDLHPLPPARGTQAMIRQVWVNLISNAIKFTKEREVGEIEIGAREDGDSGPIYSVKDNGAGFDMRYAGKLFGVFQRLHSAEEFPGTGVGLALVQRIVQRHGGRVWAEAEVNRGATFYFTLPNPKI